MLMLPVAPVVALPPAASLASNLTVCSADSELDERTTLRVPPGCSLTSAYAVDCLTGSLYSIVTRSAPVMAARSIAGLMPSSTSSGDARTSALPPASVSPPVPSYDSSTFAGAVVVKFPSSASSSLSVPVVTSDTESTPRSDAWPLSTSQPPAPVTPVALTCSLNTTSIVSRSTAVAFTTAGSCPSARSQASVELPSASPVLSRTADSSIVIVPVEFGSASAGMNDMTCTLDPFTLSGVCIVLPEPSMVSVPYAASGTVTDLLYRISAVPLPVTRAESISGTCPNGMASSCTSWPRRLAGSAAPSATRVPFILMLPVELSWTASPSNSMRCMSVVWLAGPVLLRDVPLTIMS